MLSELVDSGVFAVITEPPASLLQRLEELFAGKNSSAVRRQRRKRRECAQAVFCSEGDDKVKKV